MSILTTLELKQHLRIDDAAFDNEVAICKDAAEGYVKQYLNRPVPWADADGNDVPIPGEVKAAALMQAELLFSRPERAYAEALERTRDELLNLHRVHPGF